MKRKSKTASRNNRRNLLIALGGIVVAAFVISAATPQGNGPDPFDKQTPPSVTATGSSEGMSAESAPLAGAPFSLPMRPHGDLYYQEFAPDISDLADIERKDLDQLLRFRGPSTRLSTFFPPAWPFFILGDEYFLDEATLRNLDRIVSALRIPYFVGRLDNENWTPTMPDTAQIMLPWDSTKPEDDERVRKVVGYLYSAQKAGLLKSYEEDRRHPRRWYPVSSRPKPEPITEHR
jgi:hypothetical protein